MRVLFALALLLVAGCITSTSAPAAEPRIGYLTSGMTLAPKPEAEERTVAAGSFFAAWAQGNDYPTWRGERSTDAGRLVGDIALHLRVRVTGPVAKTFRFPDVLAYGGSGDAWEALGNASAPPVLSPGQDYVFDVKLAPPVGGLWVPPGEALGVKVVPVMHQNDAADVLLVMGGKDPSVLRWSEQPDITPTATTRSGADAGSVAGSEYAGAAAPPTAAHRTIVRLDAAPRVIEAWLNTTAHEGIPDLDLALEAPNGTQLAYSGTPTPREMVRVGDAALASTGPGEYALVVYDYGSAAAEYRVEWRSG